MNEPTTVKDLIEFLQKNCDSDDFVFVNDEGCEINLYEDNIVLSKYSVGL